MGETYTVVLLLGLKNIPGPHCIYECVFQVTLFNLNILCIKTRNTAVMLSQVICVAVLYMHYSEITFLGMEATSGKSTCMPYFYMLGFSKQSKWRSLFVLCVFQDVVCCQALCCWFVVSFLLTGLTIKSTTSLVTASEELSTTRIARMIYQVLKKKNFLYFVD